MELSTRLGAWFALAEFLRPESVIWNPGQGTLTPEDLLTRHPHMVVGDISLASRLWSTQGVVSRGRLGASVAPFFDPFRGIQEPRATVSAESEWVLRGDTEIEARGEWSTSAYALSSERPLGRSGDEVVTLSLSVSHPLRADMHIEAGLRSGFHVNRESADSLRRQEISASLALVGRLQRWSSH
ncbi:MAG: hypothetical protein R3C68_14025 [Myxococcota bacterium]